jgi:hypothetical protein
MQCSHYRKKRECCRVPCKSRCALSQPWLHDSSRTLMNIPDTTSDGTGHARYLGKMKDSLTADKGRHNPRLLLSCTYSLTLQVNQSNRAFYFIVGRYTYLPPLAETLSFVKSWLVLLALQSALSVLRRSFGRNSYLLKNGYGGAAPWR